MATTPGTFFSNIGPNRIEPDRFNRGNLPYAFALINIKSGNLLTGLPADVTNPSVLVLNPQAIQMVEPFAATLTPQQDAGLVVENRGQVIKEITISGTTGFLPKRRSGSSVSQLLSGEGSAISEAALSPDDRASELGKKSGYSDFHRLRNLFRFFGEIKRLNKPSGSIRAVDVNMVWFNTKDNEYLIVVPRAFTMTRSTPRSVLYNYSIQLTAIARLESASASDFLTPTLTNKKLTGLDTLVQASTTFTNVAAALATETGIIAGSVSKLTAQVLSPLNALTAGITSFVDGTTIILEIPRATFQTLVTSIIGLIYAADSADTLLSPDTLTSLYSSLHATYHVLVHTQLFGRDFAQQWEDLKSRVEKLEDTLERAYGEPRSDQIGVREEVVMGGENIHGFALRTLGDASRFLDVIVLNKLLPPYIVTDSTNRKLGTVAVGETLLVPTVSASSFSANPIEAIVADTQRSPTLTGSVSSATASTMVDSAQTWIAGQWVGFSVEITEGTGQGQLRLIHANATATLTPSKIWTIIPDATSKYRIFLDGIVATKTSLGGDLQLGVDLQLGSDGDIRVTGTSDLALIRGTPNLAQAIDNKFFTEPGELTLHPHYGMNVGVGTKALLDRVLTAKFNAVSSFLQDPRVDSVQDITVDFSGGHLSITARLRVKNTDVDQLIDLTRAT